MTKLEHDILPVTRSKTEARQSYNKLSRWYDLLADGSEEKYRKMGIELLDVKPGETILEIGCGTGSSLVDLAAAVGDNGSVIALDLSRGMLAQAALKIKPFNSTQIHLVAADGLYSPLSAETIDAIFISFTLELFATDEIPLVLTACKRLLKNHGRIALVSMAQSDKASMMTRLYEWAHLHWENYVDCRPIPTVKFLVESGFKIEANRRSNMWGLPVDIVLATIS